MSHQDLSKISKEKRILNEFNTKNENEDSISKVKDARGESSLHQHSQVRLECECDDKACKQEIFISTEEYEAVHNNSKQFIVVPGHVRFDIEKVIEEFPDYALVEKILP